MSEILKKYERGALSPRKDIDALVKNSRTKQIFESAISRITPPSSGLQQEAENKLITTDQLRRALQIASPDISVTRIVSRSTSQSVLQYEAAIKLTESNVTIPEVKKAARITTAGTVQAPELGDVSTTT